MSIRLELVTSGTRRYQLVPVAEAIPEGTIVENDDVWFHFETSEGDVFGVELEVDEVALDRIAVSATRARWRWNVGFHAGEASLRLVGATPSPLTLRVQTDPARAKLTRHQFTRMVGDIIADSMALAALAGHRIGVDRGHREPPGIARFELLSQCFEAIERAVREIDRSPWLRIERGGVTLPAGRCGAVTLLELSRSVASVRGLSRQELNRLPGPARRLADSLGGRLPKAITRSIALQANRRREHSDMLQALNVWRGFLRGVITGLDGLPPERRETARLLAMRKRSRGMLYRLDRLTTLPIFDGVQPSYAAPSPSHLYRRVPAYRQFFRAFHAFLSGLGDVRGDFVGIPLHQTFDLYETWCFLRLAHAAALDAADEIGWKNAVEEQVDATGLTVNIRAKPFPVGDYTLVFKQTYTEVWRPQGRKIGSYSRQMIPDIAVEIAALGGQRPVLVVDAKYRAEKGLNEALSSIHMYRDALVYVEEGTGNPRRTVRAAFVLTPQLPDDHPEDQWREDEPPSVFLRDGYHDAFRFGAVTLRPGVTIEQVSRVLRRMLAAVRAEGWNASGYA